MKTVSIKISIITLFPKMISSFFEESIVKRACDKKLVEIELINLRDFAIDDYGTVDDRPYGGGVGMVLRIEPIYNALQKIKSQKSNLKMINKDLKIVLTSPKGKVFNQNKAQEYSKLDQLIIIAGHYEGVDERVGNLIDEEISLGDFVLTGGELPACCLTDAVVRLIPGVLKKSEATKQESFLETSEGKLLEYPQYTRPEEFRGMKVPKILLSGNQKEIEKWRLKKAFDATLKKRPDLLKEKRV